MKEYKVITRKAFENGENLENRLNEYARKGWIIKFTHMNFTQFILERDK